MKEITICIVDSISDQMQEIQNKIRMRAYENFLARADSSKSELEDWLAAERELICILAASVNAEENRIVAQIEIPGPQPELLEVHAARQDVLLHVEIQGVPHSGLNNSSSNERTAFGVIRFPTAINPAGMRAEYSKGILRLTAPLSGIKSLKRTA